MGACQWNWYPPAIPRASVKSCSFLAALLGNRVAGTGCIPKRSLGTRRNRCCYSARVYGDLAPWLQGDWRFAIEGCDRRSETAATGQIANRNSHATALFEKLFAFG